MHTTNRSRSALTVTEAVLFAAAIAAVVGTGCQHPDVVLIPLPPDIEYPWAEQPTSTVVSVAAAEQRVDVAATNAVALVRSNADVFVFSVDEVELAEQSAELEARVHGPREPARDEEGDSDNEAIDRTRRVADDHAAPDITAEIAPTTVAPSATNCVDVNSASLSQLESLPRIGPAMSARIVEARPFRRNRDLLDVSGIGPATYARFESELCPD